MKNKPRMRAKDQRTLGAIIRHAWREPNPLLMHVESALDLPGYGQARLFHLNHPALMQSWQFGFFKQDESAEEIVLPCWARFDDWSIRAIDLDGDRLAIHGDALAELIRCAPAFLRAVSAWHGIKTPKNQQRFLWK